MAVIPLGTGPSVATGFKVGFSCVAPCFQPVPPFVAPGFRPVSAKGPQGPRDPQKTRASGMHERANKPGTQLGGPRLTRPVAWHSMPRAEARMGQAAGCLRPCQVPSTAVCRGRGQAGSA